jgi:ABC-type arginine transport system ATPase subunit
MADLDADTIQTGYLTSGSGTDDQDLLRVLEQLEITDLGELSLIAWRII